MSFIQALGIIFGLVMIYTTFFHYKRNEFSVSQFLFWGFIWISLLFVVIFPKMATNIVQYFGFVRTLDLLVVLAIIIIIFLTFYNYVTVNKLKKNLEKNVREESLKCLDDKL